MANAAPKLTDNLGYLLKHAYLQLEARLNEALAPFDLDARELGVLVVIAGSAPLSQQQISQRMGVDRTTMVALLDALERKGVVFRHPDVDDRRRNVVEFTTAGRSTFERAVAARHAAERAFLHRVDARGADALRDTLKVLLEISD
ncbi:MarR family winged helix-turn-helix transcriptional regulator [Spongisporangium articulatum]|uniref:MarR family winged helix-turn-helix transcriptional regulator n=1 Tax=Spongisporangium articulatum TaxID=3362603 RepID=A0ABW8AU82_9ACTN